MAEQPEGIKGHLTLDPENRLPHSRYRYVKVRFEVADQDTAVVHTLAPINPEDVQYEATKVSAPAVIFNDQSPDRRPWQRNVIYLRASEPCVATVLIYLPAEILDPVQPVPRVFPADETESTLPIEAMRSFGITVDAGSSVINIGLKGMIRVPVNGIIQRWTVMSTDDSVTSGSISISLWKDGFPNFYPTIADSIVGSAPIALTSATRAEDVALSGWTRSFNAGDVFAFNVNSVTSLKRVTVVIDYLPS